MLCAAGAGSGSRYDPLPQAAQALHTSHITWDLNRLPVLTEMPKGTSALAPTYRKESVPGAVADGSHVCRLRLPGEIMTGWTRVPSHLSVALLGHTTACVLCLDPSLSRSARP